MVSLPTMKSSRPLLKIWWLPGLLFVWAQGNKTHLKECTFQIGKLLNCCAVVWFHIMTQLVNSFWMWLFAGGGGGEWEACYFSFYTTIATVAISIYDIYIYFHYFIFSLCHSIWYEFLLNSRYESLFQPLWISAFYLIYLYHLHWRYWYVTASIGHFIFFSVYFHCFLLLISLFLPSYILLTY